MPSITYACTLPECARTYSRYACRANIIAQTSRGPFFSALLIAAGATGDVLKKSITVKRQELIRRLRERLGSRKGHVVVLFCDEAQRQSRNSYKWLRDVHDQLAYHGIRLITFLIGQPQLLAQKAGFQMSGDEQIVARFMIEQLLFHGIRDATEAATCLAGYDKTRYPEGSGPSFTSFFLPKSFAAGLASRALRRRCLECFRPSARSCRGNSNPRSAQGWGRSSAYTYRTSHSSSSFLPLSTAVSAS